MLWPEKETRRYYVEIAHQGRVVFYRTLTATSRGEAIDLAWKDFAPDGRIDFFDTSHNAWVEEL